MSALLLKLKHVPEDEHEEICELLESHDIAYYETHKGFWGVGLEAIWLHDAQALAKAHDILNDYMSARQKKVRDEIEVAKQAGQFRTLLSTFLQQPVTFVLYVLGVAGVLALSILPFMGFM